MSGRGILAVLLALCILHLDAHEFFIAPECDETWFVVRGETDQLHHVKSPREYPGDYACRVRAECPDLMRCKATCEIRTTTEKDCLWISLYGGTFPHQGDPLYCGSGIFDTASESNELTIVVLVDMTSEGDFFCNITTEPIVEFRYPCDCGWINEVKISGGVSAGINEFPMMAGLYHTTNREIICGGTIISSWWVLTAAHCVVEDTSVIEVAVGVQTSKKIPGVGQYLKLVDVILHPDYSEIDDGILENDIALLRTSKRIRFSQRVGPACLPFRHTGKRFTGDTVIVIGWGIIDEQHFPKNLLKANLTVIGYHECLKALENISYNKTLCTSVDYVNVCKGDSGGPALWQNPASWWYYLVGITTNGAGCPSSAPGVFERVMGHLDWITMNAYDAEFCKL